ncbi:unnamed protein product [Gongylonema pulchrum]|uniref:RGS domain-containing protein n=1 Tax=Gongylonema pulchrum TaxID=637853 RepID=A0A183DUH0_9BILA|nr:unnamed protein product [Gongylonema pulchrum]
MKNQYFYKADRKEDLGPQRFSGASAAQSSVFHVIDEFLGIEHFGVERAFLDNQRGCMPPKHREFIVWVRQNASKIPDIKESADYQETLQAVQKFREAHIKEVYFQVMKFIVFPAGDATGLGTGGSSFMRLLLNIVSDCKV